MHNLEWTNKSGNALHAFANNLSPLGERHPNSKYTNDQIHQVCKLLEDNNICIEEISKITGVSDKSIGNILHKRIWVHISKNYNIDNYTLRKKHKVQILPLYTIRKETVIKIRNTKSKCSYKDDLYNKLIQHNLNS